MKALLDACVEASPDIVPLVLCLLNTGLRKGEAITLLWEQFDRARKRAGLSGGPHVCRHTFASHLLRACADLFLLAKLMGHSDTTVTRLYAHLLPDHLERARNAVDFASPASPKRLKERAKEIRSQTARQAGKASGRSRAAAAARAEKAA